LELREPPDDRRRAELLVKVGAARWGAGVFEAKPLEEAAVLAERLGDADLLARAALVLAGPNAGTSGPTPIARAAACSRSPSVTAPPSPTTSSGRSTSRSTSCCAAGDT